VWWNTQQWKAISRRYRKAHPMCEWPGCIRRSEIVHHIRGDGRLGREADNSDENLQALCRSHHAQIPRAEHEGLIADR
jgi:hypothetical protein